MKRTISIFFVLAVCGLVFMSAPVSGDAGPHGSYTATTDACAGCHRTHTAGAGKLLTISMLDLCYTCHGVTSGGAQTDVRDGLLITTTNASLKGGGFEYAVMNTALSTTILPVSSTVTSRHEVSTTTAIAWGNGAFGSGPGPGNFGLSCIACHNPHGKASTLGAATYRILRGIPLGSGGSGVNVSDTANKVYSISDDAEYWYMNESYGSRSGSLAQWCAQCHTRYLAPVGAQSNPSSDPIFKYRHSSNYTSVHCLSCHVAHGTTAVMGTYSGAVAWPGGTTSPSGNARSSLLRADNRGVCASCHVDEFGNMYW